MIPELGHFALIIALCLAIAQAFFPLAGTQLNKPRWMAVAKPAARGQFIFLLIAFASLTTAFIQNDFSVLYVAKNSNSLLPIQYRISAVWGSHEGSLLLWALILGIWTLAVTLFSRHLPQTMVARVLGVMGLISIGFLLFMLFTSNPFDRLLPAAVEGRDLNPLLQDFGLIIHPPMLYMGYVGFSVAFAFAIAALLGGKLDSAWARWSRPWTTMAWCFLTIGIALGSWWAYYELGWGGWWFWDPVENASFMPWLVGTALIHSLAVTEKRGSFKSWTVMLAILAFSLSLLGTFLVRSGVVTSVHAFATDPTRGIFILVFLGVVIGGSLLLYAFKANDIRSAGRFSLLSRETLLLVNNVLLIVVCATILLGTLYPMVLDAMGAGKISVGMPYFNFMFTLFMLPLVFLLAVGPLTRWKKHSLADLLNSVKILFIISLLTGIASYFILATISWPVAMVIALFTWITGGSFLNLYKHVQNKPRKFAALAKIPLSYYGMFFAHIGVAVFMLGATFASNYSEEKDIRMEPGSTLDMAGYNFQFKGTQEVNGPNYRAQEGTIVVSKNQQEITTLKPQKRLYLVQRSPMTEAGIDGNLMRDLFIALGEPLGNGEWSVRIQYKPLIRWIWLGTLIMAFGGLLALSDKRYRFKKKLTVGEVVQ
ncbi:MAG TPA: heme lyase CcmF/NrfE family subunit [Gammaproteobacteria bacterium]|nr:heme lyase CcmF/NrfE family subunit [Gammaproteobacteria bacterium]